MNKQKMHKKLVLITIIFLMAFLPIFNVRAQPGLEILNIEVIDIDGRTVEIKWSTNIASYGKVIFGESKDNLPYFIIDSKGTSKLHSVKLGNLKEKTNYYYQISAYYDFEEVQSFIKKFKTGDFHDNIPPKLSNLKIPYVSGTAAVIKWETDERSSSRVEFDAKRTYRNRAGSGSKVIKHMVVLKRLKPGKQYFIRVYSVDKDKNKSSITHREFTTHGTVKADRENLKISHLRPSGPNDSQISTNSINVSFKTNHYAKGKVSIKKKGFRTQTNNLDYSINHSAFFSELSPNNSYNIEISMSDIFGKRKKEKFIVTTKKVAVINGEDLEGQIDDEPVVLGAEFSFYTPATALYKVTDSHRIYSIINNKYYYITTPASFWEYGYQWKDVKTINKETLLKYPRAKLIKSPDRPAVYYLYKQGDKILKIKIPSPSVFSSYPGNSWADVVKVTQTDIDAISDVKLIKTKDDPAVYYLENGIKRYVSAEVFMNRGFSFGDIMTVNQVHLDSYQAGNPLN